MQAVVKIIEENIPEVIYISHSKEHTVKSRLKVQRFLPLMEDPRKQKDCRGKETEREGWSLTLLFPANCPCFSPITVCPPVRPQLVCLNLSNNRLYKLDEVAELASKAPHLKTLNLSHNEVRVNRRSAFTWRSYL